MQVVCCRKGEIRWGTGCWLKRGQKNNGTLKKQLVYRLQVSTVKKKKVLRKKVGRLRDLPKNESQYSGLWSVAG